MRRVEKPWGYELIWAETDLYVAKVLAITAGHSLSRQYHVRKDETFYVQEGEMQLELGAPPQVEVRVMRPGDGYHCKPGTVHRMVAITNVLIFEVSTPDLDDVVRLEDAYGRKGTTAP